jgi:hypothetical protein
VAGSHGEGWLRWDNRGGCRLVELHGLLVRRMMVRRLKKDVMAQLPPKRRQVRGDSSSSRNIQQCVMVGS